MALISIRRILLGAVAGLAAVSASCDGEGPPRAEPVARVLVVGMDGLEWSVLQPLLVEGKCPNLRALIERGSFGRLATLNRTLSPLVWTTIATGRLPRDHGITNFLKPPTRPGEPGQVFTSADRRVPAIWNLADRYGLSTNMFGWFITWPVEPVRGLAVSGSSSSALSDANWKPALAPSVPHQVHPLAREAEIMAEVERVSTREEIARLAREKVYGPIPAGVLDKRHEEIKQQTLWSLSADATYFALARREIAERPADLNLVYFGGTDVAGHRYWREYRPEGFRYSNGAEADRLLAKVLPNYYEWVDEMLGQLVQAAGPDTTVFVLSDHGMHEHSTDKPDELGMTGHHLDAPPGVVIAAGPGIVRQGGVERLLAGDAPPLHGSVVDMAPTLLALLGIPGGRDMGRAYLPILEPGPARDKAKLPLIETHDAFFKPAAPVAVPRELDESFIEKFGSIGYLDLELPDMADEIVVPVEDSAPPR
ncbi:MAG: alkaline phosphatase family protein [Planctomycetota bacterium]